MSPRRVGSKSSSQHDESDFSSSSRADCLGLELMPRCDSLDRTSPSWPLPKPSTVAIDLFALVPRYFPRISRFNSPPAPFLIPINLPDQSFSLPLLPLADSSPDECRGLEQDLPRSHDHDDTSKSAVPSEMNQDLAFLRPVPSVSRGEMQSDCNSLAGQGTGSNTISTLETLFPLLWSDYEGEPRDGEDYEIQVPLAEKVDDVASTSNGSTAGYLFDILSNIPVPNSESDTLALEAIERKTGSPQEATTDMTGSGPGLLEGTEIAEEIVKDLGLEAMRQAYIEQAIVIGSYKEEIWKKEVEIQELRARLADHQHHSTETKQINHSIKGGWYRHLRSRIRHADNLDDGVVRGKPGTTGPSEELYGSRPPNRCKPNSALEEIMAAANTDKKEDVSSCRCIVM
ncbi:hypothetical protein FRC02_006658 [Tulasnella sp. 418]|nr:hypothetical protein FRC02_006658 [Tulasnella sp. 418]